MTREDRQRPVPPYLNIWTLIYENSKWAETATRKLRAIETTHLDRIDGDLLYEVIKQLYISDPESIYLLSETCFGIHHLIKKQLQLLMHRNSLSIGQKLLKGEMELHIINENQNESIHVRTTHCQRACRFNTGTTTYHASYIPSTKQLQYEATSPHYKATSPHYKATSPHYKATSPHYKATSPHSCKFPIRMTPLLSFKSASMVLILFMSARRPNQLLLCNHGPIKKWPMSRSGYFTTQTQSSLIWQLCITLLNLHKKNLELSIKLKRLEVNSQNHMTNYKANALLIFWGARDRLPEIANISKIFDAATRKRGPTTYRPECFIR